MAIYHLSVKVLSRKQGKNAVFAAAYRAGERLEDESSGQIADYSRRHVLHQEIIYPPEAPSWLVADRQTLWNAVEKSNKRKDSQVAREIEISLPAELILEQQIELVRGYVQEQFVKEGMIADVTINKPPEKWKGELRNSDPRNIYAQILLTTQSVNSEGFGLKNRRWDRKNLLNQWRVQWQNHANAALEKAGKPERIDHRSLKTQGLQCLSDEKPSNSSQETKRSDYKLISVHQANEVLVKAYVVWLRSRQIEGQNENFQKFKDIFEKLFEDKPKKNNKDYKNYAKWASSISHLQDKFLEQIKHGDGEI